MKTLLAILGLLLSLILLMPDFASAAPRNCVRGPLRDQKLSVQNEDRFYFSYMPLNYDCMSKLPVVIDLHGAVSGTDRPEEAYGLDDATEFANRRGVLVVRPRSRFALNNQQKVFSWDAQGARDISANVAFINALVENLRSRLPISENQIYLIGFSNGSAMASRFLAVTPQVFAGFGFIGGGLTENPGPVSVNTARTRLYIASGSKDIAVIKKWNLIEYLTRNRYPLPMILERRTDSAHQLSRWHYLDFWNWMQGRDLPTTGLPFNWVVVPLPGARSILDITKDASGGIYASTDNGQIWKRRDASRWDLLFQAGKNIPFASLCVLESGSIVAGGANVLIQSTPDQKGWRSVVLPETTKTWINSVSCGKNHFFAATFPYGFIGTDIESLTAPRVMGPSIGAELLSSALAPDARVVSIGARGAVGFSTDNGRSFRYAFNAGLDRRWLYDLKYQGSFWGAGENGMIANIDSRGTLRTLETGVRDLFTIYMSERGLGAAGGLFGAFVVSRDGGRSWRNLSLDVGFSFSAVQIDNDNTIILGDEYGRIYYVRPSLWP